MGVDLMTFDNKEELVKILKYHETPRLVCLRVVVRRVRCEFLPFGEAQNA